MIENGNITTLITDKNQRFSLGEIQACADAVLLRKKQIFPLGQPIPIPDKSRLGEQKSVSKILLKNAIKKGELIKLTLSLSPFQIGL